MQLVYTALIWIGYILGKCFYPFSHHVQKWYDGRKNQTLTTTKNSIWVHCASLGEYLQIKSLIQKIKEEKPDQTIVLSFFSPSGFNHFKDHALIDHCYYIPLDVPSQMQAFLDAIQPRLVIFTKNEVWFNLIDELKNRTIPFVFVASTFNKKSKVITLCKLPFFSNIKRAHVIYVQHEKEARDLKSFGFEHIHIAGDPRIENALQRKNEVLSDSKIISFVHDARRVCICGSTHEADEKIILPVLEKSKIDKIIIAPHHVDPGRIEQIKSFLKNDYTVYSEEINTDCRWMILDTVGLLANIYHYADIVYIGGGFSKGIHNTLEPAVYGKPILFGPRYAAFQEAKDFVEHEAAFVITDASSMNEVIEKLDERELAIAETLEKYFKEKQGATDRIFRSLKTKSLLS